MLTWLSQNGEVGAHHIIGLTILVSLVFQALLGICHHILFKHHHRRTVPTYMHFGAGWAILCLGWINIFLFVTPPIRYTLANHLRGLRTAGNPLSLILLWIGWLVVVCFAILRLPSIVNKREKGNAVEYDLVVEIEESL